MFCFVFIIKKMIGERRFLWGGVVWLIVVFLFVYQPTKNRNKKEGKGRFLLEKEGLVSW